MRIGVVGNEACDADSIVSAIVFSEHLNYIDSANNKFYGAFVQCSEDQLKDRLDFAEILSIAGLSLAQITIRSIRDDVADIDSWILMDHHFPSPLFFRAVPRPKILRVLDHHPVITRESDLFLQGVEHEIRLVGSTCSLVAEKVDFFTLRRQSVLMLLLVIVLDTANLNSEVGIATDLDMEMHKSLSIHLNLFSTEAYWNRLVKSKFSPSYWAGASSEKMLSYDFKQVDCVGYSTVFVRIDRLSATDVSEFAKSRKLRYVVVIGAYLPEKQSADSLPNRELLVFSEDSRSLALIHKSLIAKISLHQILEESSWSTLRYRVPDRGLSRKKFIPVFSMILRDLS